MHNAIEGRVRLSDDQRMVINFQVLKMCDLEDLQVALFLCA